MTNEQHVNEIMKLVRNMESDRVIGEALLAALQDTFKRGYDVAFLQYANYREDMGR